MEKETHGSYTYQVLEDGTVEILAYNGNDEVVVIPAKLKGRFVTRIGNRAFIFKHTLKSVHIPSGVTAIGERAFHCCRQLRSVDIPDSVAAIGGARSMIARA